MGFHDDDDGLRALAYAGAGGVTSVRRLTAVE